MDAFEQTDLSRPVGQFLQPAETTLRADTTIGAALAALQGKRIEQKAIYFYAVDEQRRLLGVVSARKLLLSDPGERVQEIMDRPAVSIRATATLEEAMELFALYRLLALPVVDDEERLIGQIDVSLYAEEAMDLGEAHRVADLFQLLGMSVQHVKQRRALWAYRLRMPWLLCNVAGGLACAVIAAAFARVLAEVVMLAMFLPLVLTLSEAIAMQSMALSLQFLHAGGPRWRRTRLRLAAEWRAALLIALTCAVLAALAAGFWANGRPVAVIAVSVAGAMICAASLGTLIPVLLHALRMDPKVAAGPVALMLSDMLTTALYLGLGTVWLA